ncbi:MAG TPA: 3D domain-containing protein [Blastocatellia bacterium]|nr:3D domain-containing protein [Blastocatellia bacterium]
MNRFANRRIANLSSVVSVVALMVVGYAVDERTDSALAAGGPSYFSARRVQDSKAAGKKADTDSSSHGSGDQSKSTSDAPEVQLKSIELDKRLAESLTYEDTESGSEEFHATAYSLKGRTASGEFTRPGIIAADPRVLPIGTVVHIRAGKYTGTYTVKDTGGMIKGRRVDIYVPSYEEAMLFGRQRVALRIVSRVRRVADSPKYPVRAKARA